MAVTPAGRRRDDDDAPVSFAQGAACLIPHAVARTHRLLAEVPTGLGPEGAVVDERRRRAYVSSSRADELTIVDLDAMRPIGSLRGGREPTDLAIDDQADRLLVCDLHTASVTVVDLERFEVIASIDVDPYPSGMALDVPGRRLYCGCAAGASVSVVDLDSLERIASWPAELGAGGVALDPVRGRAYCANFLTASITALDLDSGRCVGRLAVGDAPCSAVAGERSLWVAISGEDALVRVDLDSFEIAARIGVGRGPVGLNPSLSGDRIYAGNRGEGTISIVGTADDTEWARVPVGEAPAGCVVDPGTGHVLVSNAGSATVSIIEDLVDGPARADAPAAQHPLVGRPLPPFELADLRTGKLRSSLEWAERKYILNFFASW